MLAALTGGIGSGKSYIMKLFERCGAKTLYSDKINAELLTDEKYLEGLKKLFPDCFEGSVLDKRALRRLIFSSESARKKLNGYAHPEILKRIRGSVAEDGVIICEIPLLTESNSASIFDKIIYVEAPEALRIERICKRDGVRAEDAAAAIRAQKSERNNIDCADYIINNEGDPSSQVESIYGKLCATE